MLEETFKTLDTEVALMRRNQNTMEEMDDLNREKALMQEVAYMRKNYIKDGKNKLKLLKDQIRDAEKSITYLEQQLRDTSLQRDEAKLEMDDCIQQQLQREEELQDLIRTMDECEIKYEKTRKSLNKVRKYVEKEESKLQKEIRRIGYEELRSGLIGFYSKSYETVEVSPLPQVGERSAKMLDIYVQPTMFQVETDRLKRAFNQNLSSRRKMKSYQDIFSKGGKCCKNIYITGEKGVGKSVFAKKMALAWCQAHSPKERDQNYFSKEDILEMQKFDLLFLLPLMNSDSLELCDIDDMILQQIFPRLDSLTVRSMDFLETILHERQYLVILDGLDQWSHPVSCRNRNSDIPHMKARENYTILTTTSPWKLEEVQLKSSQIDQHIEMMGLEMNTAGQLISYVLQHLRFTTQREMSENLAQFHTFYEKYKMQTFISTPVMLMLLVCLWAEKWHVGMSRCAIYKNIVDLLFRRVVLETSDETLRRITETCMHSPSQDNRLFLEVGKLAFYTAFSLQRESCLVFESMVVDQYLSRNILQVCLISGLLSRHESYESIVERKSKISFLHKSIQEYFAAYYIQAASDPSYISDVILRRCYSVSAFLEMSNVFIFLSGLNPQRVTQVFRLLLKLMSVDDVIQTYRSTVVSKNPVLEHNPSDALIRVKELQTLIVSCVLESKANGSDLLQIGIQDIIFDESSEEGSYNSALIDLVKLNSGSIKSISLSNVNDKDICAKIVDVCGEQTFSSLQKLEIEAFFLMPAAIENLLRSVETLRCLTLSGIYQRLGSTFEMIQRMSQLEALQLEYIRIPHKQMTDLLAFIEGRPNMRHISLVLVGCGGRRCAGHSLNLTQQSNLQVLNFFQAEVSDVRVNVTSLKELIFYARADLQLLQLLPEAVNLQTLKVHSPSDSSAVTRALPRLQHLKCFKLSNCSIDDDTLELPMSGHLEELTFIAVEFRGQTLFNLLRRLESAAGAQPVKLQLERCSVPEDEYQRVREYVNSSPRFTLLKDEQIWGRFNLSCQIVKFD